MSNRNGTSRSTRGILEFLAKLGAVFSLFVVAGSLLGTGTPNPIALVVFILSIALVTILSHFDE